MQTLQVDTFNQLPDDLDALKQIAAQEGLPITGASFQNGLNGMTMRARQYYESKQRNKRLRPEWYDRGRNFVLAARDAIAMSVNFVLVVIGIPVALVALFISEIIAVHLGIGSFLNDNIAVTALSVTTIVAYFALLWYRASMAKIEARERNVRFSFRIWADRLSYILGKGTNEKEWEPKFKAERLNSSQSSIAIRWLMILIVILGVLGRLNNERAMTTGSWLDGLIFILEQSTLSELMTYIGGGMISLSLLIATHYLIHFVHNSYEKAVGSTETDFFSEDESAGLALAEMEATKEYYRSKILAHRQMMLNRSQAQETTQ